MIVDERQRILAKNLVHYSCEVQPGENVLIEASGVPYQFVNLIVREVFEAGAFPFVSLGDNKVKRELLRGGKEEYFKRMAKYDEYKMRDMQAYIGIRGGENSCELSDATGARFYNEFYAGPVHNRLRVKNTKWVILRYPTEGMSELAGMSTEAYEDFYFYVCCLDYKKMGEAMTPLVELMNKTDKVRIIAKDTDLTFSIKGIGAVKCKGDRNIPDGEVYTAPVKDSINGVIHYNVPSIEDGIKFEDVRLVFKDGKIVEATANHTEEANKIFDTDAGARYVGEFSFGLNPCIKKAIGDILFDEKISGSIHFTPGCCYDDAYNGNTSAVHWDLVLCQTPECGGGEIWFDGVLVRKDGRFVLPELQGLNPENLI